MTRSVASAVAQFFAFIGEIWVLVAALAKPESSWSLEYERRVSWEVYGGKKPWELANDVEFGTEAIIWTRSQAAVLYLLPDQTARSEPPAKAGAGFGPFSLGIGKEAHCDLPTALAGKVLEAHGPSTYMSSLPRAKSSFAPPEVAPGLPSSVWPTYLAGERWLAWYRST